MDVKQNTFPVLNRDNQTRYLMIEDNNTVILYGYTNIQITGDTKILAVDPNGGPIFWLTQNIRPMISNGNPLQLPPVYIYDFLVTNYVIIIKTSDIEERGY